MENHMIDFKKSPTYQFFKTNRHQNFEHLGSQIEIEIIISLLTY